jgi:hypothetical protein
MVGMLYRSRLGHNIYACISIDYAHIPLFTMFCVADGDTWVVKGLRELDRYFEPLQPKEE